MKKNSKIIGSLKAAVVITIALAFILPGSALVVNAVPGSIDVNVEEAKQMIESDSLAIVDVRSLQEYDSGHINGAVSVPFLECSPCFLSGMEKYKNEKIVVYCTNGDNSRLASEFLVENGFTQVYNLLGGVTAWKNAGFPVVRLSPKDGTYGCDTSQEDVYSNGLPNSSPLLPENIKQTPDQLPDKKIISKHSHEFRGKGNENMVDNDNDGVGDELEDDLLEEFAPVVLLHLSEDRWPCNVDWFLERSYLRFHHSWSKDCPILGRGITQYDLISQAHQKKHWEWKWPPWKTGWYHSGAPVRSWCDEFDDDQCFFLQMHNADHSGSKDPNEWIVYGHVYPNIFGGINIQYWFFYAYNDHHLSFNHEGDWEHILVELEFDGINLVVKDLIYYAHDGGTCADNQVVGPSAVTWYEDEAGTHPVVMSALGGHSSYHSWDACDDHSCYLVGERGCYWCEPVEQCPRAWFTWENGKPPESLGYQGGRVINVGERHYGPGNVPVDDINGQKFIHFNGRWGELGICKDTSGPQGPAYQGCWWTNIDEGPINEPPYVPSDPSPWHGAIDVEYNVVLSWEGGDPNPGDTVTYDVYFGRVGAMEKVVDHGTETTYNPGTLSDGWYYWQVVAYDQFGMSTASPIWSFITNFVPLVYVDDDYASGDPGWGEYRFDNIPDGINGVEEGGIVMVYDGIYYGQNIEVHKSLSLMGDSSTTTFIRCTSSTGPIITVTADRVNISGFTIEYYSWPWPSYGSPTVIDIYSSHNTISRNNICNGNFGVRLQTVASYNDISHNTIVAGPCGITLWDSNYNRISDNTIITEVHDIWYQDGIYLDSSSANTIERNSLYHAYGNGMGCRGYSICLIDSSNNNIIKGNTMDCDPRITTYGGIGIHGGSSSNTICENTVNSRGSAYSVNISHGSSGNVIYHNNFYNGAIAAYGSGSNIWDKGCRNGGNYWNDNPNPWYDGYCGVNQNIPCSGDGIMDIPGGGRSPYYIIGASQWDWYPLMNPWMLENALSFDGGDDSVIVVHDDSLDIGNEMRVEAWIYPRSFRSRDHFEDDLAGWSVIASKDAGSTWTWLFVVGNCETDNPNLGRLSFQINGEDGASGPISNPVVPTNQWSHVVGVYDGAQILTYLNGELVFSHPKNAGDLKNFDICVEIGGDKDYPEVENWIFEGIIDEVKVYSGASGNEDDKILEFLFNEGFGTIAHDTSGSNTNLFIGGNHGTIYGAEWVPNQPVLDYIGTQFIPFGYKRPLPNIFITALDPYDFDLEFSCWGLPNWLHFTDNGDGTALIHGTMMLFGPAVYQVTVSVTNGYKYDSEEFLLWFYDPDDPPFQPYDEAPQI